MTRNSTDDRYLVLGQTYLYWLENEVFPYLFGTVCILELIVGVTVNIFITLLYKKHRKDDTFIANINFIIADFIAHCFVLLPAIGISLSTAESLPSALCSTFGVINNTVFIFQFGIINFVFVCICISLHKGAGSLFPRPLVVIIVSAIVLFSSLLVAVLPLVTDNYQLQKPEHRCGIDKSSLKYFTNISFIPFFGSLLSALVALGFLIKSVINNDSFLDSKPESDSEHQTDITEQTGDSDNAPVVNDTKLIKVAETSEVNNIQTEESSLSDNEVENDNCQTESRQSVAITINNEIPEHAWSHQESFSGTSASTKRDSGSTDMTSTTIRTPTSSTQTDSHQMSEHANSIAYKYAVFSGIFNGKVPCKLHIKNAVTYIVIWLIMFVCWCPYVVFSYITMYSSLWWDGWMTVAVCFGYISYCTKPIVILTMRKDLRQKSAEFLPQSFSKKAKQIELKLKAVL